MLKFIIDDQTFQDLNIFSQYGSPVSLFDLFKGTRTIGGRSRVNDMMRNPSCDLEEIKKRSSAIAYFTAHQLVFDVRKEELDLIELYLSSDKRKSKSNIIDVVSDYFTRNSSNDYYIIQSGIKYLIKLAKYLKKLAEEQLKLKVESDLPQYLEEIFERILQIIADGILDRAIGLNEHALRFYKINILDKAFRGVEKLVLLELLALVYELDVFEYVSYVAKEKQLSFPEFVEGDGLKMCIHDFFHPQIPNAVKNNAWIDHDTNIIFLTGANMAGKSSLLKSIATCIYLAHIGFPVPASAMQTNVFDGLCTTINLADNMNDGLSHYYSEVRRVKEVGLKLVERDRMFVIFDELFRGTNVKDAFDASTLIISEFSAIRNSAFVISTHIVEIADELTQFPNVCFKYMETLFENDRPVFTYQLREGISKERLGMYIVINEGVVEVIRLASEKQSARIK